MRPELTNPRGLPVLASRRLQVLFVDREALGIAGLFASTYYTDTDYSLECSMLSAGPFNLIIREQAIPDI